MDFSKALFVCTANDINTIPQPLLDRMEVIRISGYDYKEKLEISKNYLDKKARKATGLEVYSSFLSSSYIEVNQPLLRHSPLLMMLSKVLLGGTVEKQVYET